MGRLEEASFATGYVLLTFFAVCVAVAVFASSAAQNYPLYTVTPNSCDPTKHGSSIIPYYQGSAKNASDPSAWVLGEWYMLPRTGFCPLGERKTLWASGSRNGDSSSSPTSYAYHKCIQFRSPSNWQGSFSDVTWDYIDSKNAANGYATDLHHDALKWYSSGALSDSATVFLWIWLTGIIVGYWFPIAVAIAIGALPFAFAFWLGALGTLYGSGLLDKVAWSTFFFYSCSVEIVRDRGYALGTYCVVTTGCYLIAYTLLIVQYYFKSGGGFFTAEKSLNDFHTVLIRSPWASRGSPSPTLAEPAKSAGGGAASPPPPSQV